MYHVSCVMWHMCRISPGTCHMSKKPTATASDPPPLSTVGWLTAGWSTKGWLKKKLKIAENHLKRKGEVMPILAMHPLTRGLYSSSLGSIISGV